MRIVSLLASGTELVFALGAGERLVGRSHECDYPEHVKALPVVSRPTFDITGSSAEIDALVRERLGAGAPLYVVDDAKLDGLAPDVLITQTHCEVCAVTPGDVTRGTPASSCRNQVVALRAGTLEGILEGFVAVARVLGLESGGHALVAECREKLAAVRARVDGYPRPSVVCLEWIEPVFTMGNWGPEIVDCAGGESLLGRAGEHSTTTPWDAVRAANPDVLVIAPCGFGIDRTMREMPLLRAQPGWSDLAAVRAGRVFVADGNLHFNRSSPTLFDTPAMLAEMLHPEAFPEAAHHAWWRGA